MTETELKLQVPAARRAEVDAAVAGRAPLPRTRLQAAYHDTPDRTLASAGLALRVRREGRQWVQTLKGAGDDGLSRAEHNLPRGAGAEMPPLEPALHAGTQVGDRLIALLRGEPALQALYGTDIRRRTRALAVRRPGQPGARVELAFDLGLITAGKASIEVCELEIELLAGSPLAVIETARRWLPRFGLWIDLRSKAERGDLLARGERIAPARGAAAVKLEPAMSGEAAWQAVLRGCAEQVLANASQIASGAHGAEHVHQLRVGLRRLRSALALFDRDDADPLGSGAASLFRALGAARDGVVIDGEFGAALTAAMHAAGLPLEPPPLAAPAADSAPPALLRDAAVQAWLLDLLAAMQAPPAAEPSPIGLLIGEPLAGKAAGKIAEEVAQQAADPMAAPMPGPPPAGPSPPPLRELLAARLNRWHRQLVADAKRYAELDDEARHRLRKRAKRLRYAAEFSAALFGQRALRRYLKALRALQERLGAVSDVVMAMAAFAPRAATEPAAMFALGWLAARRDALIAEAAPELAAFVQVKRFWKARPPKRRGG